ncbi:MAG: hypothetical protein ABWZ03_08320, partial [Solirubrobacterales bacterium]
DPELLAAALAAETALGDAYAIGGEGGPAPPQREAIESFIAASRRRAEELTTLLEQAGGQPTKAATPEPGSEREQANATIAAYRAAAGPLSTEELRGTAIAFLAAVAAELSVMSEFAGEDPAPRPFVTGLEAEPYVAADEDSADEETTTEATTTAEGEQTTTEEQP